MPASSPLSEVCRLRLSRCAECWLLWAELFLVSSSNGRQEASLHGPWCPGQPASLGPADKLVGADATQRHALMQRVFGVRKAAWGVRGQNVRGAVGQAAVLQPWGIAGAGRRWSYSWPIVRMCTAGLQGAVGRRCGHSTKDFARRQGLTAAVKRAPGAGKSCEPALTSCRLLTGHQQLCFLQKWGSHWAWAHCSPCFLRAVLARRWPRRAPGPPTGLRSPW